MDWASSKGRALGTAFPSLGTLKGSLLIFIRLGESWYLSYWKITCHRLTPSWGHSESLHPPTQWSFISEVVPAPPSVYTFRYPIREALIPEPSRKASRSLNLHTCSEPSATSEPVPIQGSVSCLREGEHGPAQPPQPCWGEPNPTVFNSTRTWNDVILLYVPANPSLSLLTTSLLE